jgi:murein DD-endopeptidase MepM/ murein hydrolase activator NlpD
MPRHAILLIVLVAATACAPLQPLPPMRPLPEPPAESPLPYDTREVMPAETHSRDYDLEELHGRGLLVPVAGIDARNIPDTFNDARDGARRHNAVDILAKRGTPVIAADDGTIIKVGTNALGGNVIWAMDQQKRFVYYYAHLDHYARGMHDGQPITRGDVLGYVGTTGNAPKDVPHLHFQLLRLNAGTRYSEGPPVNPLPFFSVMHSTK